MFIHWQHYLMTPLIMLAITVSGLDAAHVMTFTDVSNVTPEMRASLGSAIARGTSVCADTSDGLTTITFGESFRTDESDLLALMDILPQILSASSDDINFVKALTKLGQDSPLVSVGRQAREVYLKLEPGLLTVCSDFDAFLTENDLVEKVKGNTSTGRYGLPSLKVQGKYQTWPTIKQKLSITQGEKLSKWKYVKSTGLVPAS